MTRKEIEDRFGPSDGVAMSMFGPDVMNWHNWYFGLTMEPEIKILIAGKEYPVKTVEDIEHYLRLHNIIS